QGAAHNDRVAVHAENKHCGLGSGPKPPDQVQSREFVAVDPEVDDHDIGVEAVEGPDGLGRGVRLHRRTKTSVLDEPTTALSHNWVVIDYQDRGHRFTHTNFSQERIVESW